MKWLFLRRLNGLIVRLRSDSEAARGAVHGRGAGTAIALECGDCYALTLAFKRFY